MTRETSTARALGQKGAAEMVTVTMYSNFTARIVGPNWRGSARTHIGRSALWEVFDNQSILVTHRAHDVAEVGIALARHYGHDGDVVVVASTGEMIADTRHSSTDDPKENR